EDDSSAPADQEQDEREGTVETEEGLTPPARQQSGDGLPGAPGGAVEESGEADPAADATRQNDRLERVPQHRRQQDEPGGRHDPSHVAAEEENRVRSCSLAELTLPLS